MKLNLWPQLSCAMSRVIKNNPKIDLWHMHSPQYNIEYYYRKRVTKLSLCNRDPPSTTWRISIIKKRATKVKFMIPRYSDMQNMISLNYISNI